MTPEREQESRLRQWVSDPDELIYNYAKHDAESVLAALDEARSDLAKAQEEAGLTIRSAMLWKEQLEADLATARADNERLRRWLDYLAADVDPLIRQLAKRALAAGLGAAATKEET